jgi:integrase
MVDMMNSKLARIAAGEITDRWYVYYYFRHPETSKLVRFREFVSSKIKTKTARHTEALKMCAAINEKLNGGWSPFEKTDKTQRNIRDAINEVVELKMKITPKKRTQLTYRSALNNFFTFLEKNKLQMISVSAFSRDHAQAYLDWCIMKRHHSNRTHNNMLQFMKTIFNDLIKRSYLYNNVWNQITELPIRQAEVSSFSNQELAIIKNHLPGYDYPLWAIANLIFHAYIRIAEIVRLRISDFNMQHRIIIIRPEVSKNNKQYIIGMHEELYEVMLQMNLNYPSDYYLFGHGLLPGSYEINTTRVFERWNKFKEQYGIKQTLYKLKHTGAGMSVEAGVNIRDLQLQLRHSSLEMTQIYLNKFKQVVSSESLKKFATFGK